LYILIYLTTLSNCIGYVAKYGGWLRITGKDMEEVVVAFFKVLSQNLQIETEESKIILQSGLKIESETQTRSKGTGQ
jgi:hypothetical protein